MNASAFVPSLTTSIFSPVPTSVGSTIRKSATLTPRRRRVSPRSAIDTTASATDPTPPNSPFNHDDQNTIRDFAVSLMGVYAAMSDVPSASAVPESLVEAFKSIPASLGHPVTMWALLGTCVYTFYLGYQSSQIRKVEPEKRKVLLKAKVTDRHFQTSATLFAIMTCATFGGMANTYTRTGKLFPGPHLYAGLGLVATMSVMVSLVPRMQKGKEWARQAHFSLAFVALSMFGWQAKTGMDIVAKLLHWK